MKIDFRSNGKMVENGSGNGQNGGKIAKKMGISALFLKYFG